MKNAGYLFAAALATLGTLGALVMIAHYNVDHRPAIVSIPMVMQDNTEILEPGVAQAKDILMMAQSYMRLAVSVSTEKTANEWFDLKDQIKHLKADNQSLAYENAQLRAQLPQAVILPYHAK